MPVEERGLSSSKTRDVTRTRRVACAYPETVRTLQNALHAKAKQAPSYRFYTLYDKIYRADVLRLAYRCSLANAGAPGVDGQTFEQIEAYGRQRWLDELAEESLSHRGPTHEP